MPVLVRSSEWEEIPVFAYLLEHDDGHIVVDTGMAHQLMRNLPRLARRVADVRVEADEEVGPGLRRLGISPEDVRLVIATHLHPDHAGGLGHFPKSEILVHRPEYEFSRRWFARPLSRPADWPSWFRPRLYDMQAESYGPFPESHAVARGVRLLPIPGHSIGQVAVAVENGDVTMLFSGDHTVREETFIRDGDGDPRGTLYPHWRAARSTQRLLVALVRSRPTVLIPAHDPGSPARLVSRATVSL